MRTFLLLILSMALFACGGGEKQARPDSPQPAADPAPPTDPMAAACEAGTAKSCLVAGENAETAGDLESAAKWWSKACELGEATGCALAGGTLANTGQVDEGGALLARGCELEEATSCYGAALVKMGMFGGERTPAEAAPLFERGCSLGLADACGALAGLLESGAGVPADAERAAKLRRQACDEGDASSCIALASVAIDDGDLETGVALLESACESDGVACTRRGLIALQREEDPTAAREYFQLACTSDLKDVAGCGWLGWLVYEGLGGEAEPERGRAMIGEACAAESAAGCMFQAVAHARDGEDGEAQNALDRACELDEDQCDALRAQYERLAD